MTAAVRCVVFDIDDTLYLERDYVRSGFRSLGPWVRQQLGVADFTERAWHLFERGARGDIFNRVLAEAGRAPEPGVIAELVRRYRTHEPALALLPDARDCLTKLGDTARLAVLSDGPLDSQRRKAAALGLGTFCNPIVLTAELAAGSEKPSEAGYRHIAQTVGVPHPACVYVGDNPAKDFAAPARLGWRTVRVRRREGLHVAVASGPDVTAELSDLSGLQVLLSLT